MDVPKCPKWAKRNIDSSYGERAPAAQATVQICSGQPGKFECALCGWAFPPGLCDCHVAGYWSILLEFRCTGCGKHGR